jgi:hypothetical protein
MIVPGLLLLEVLLALTRFALLERGHGRTRLSWMTSVRPVRKPASQYPR